MTKKRIMPVVAIGAAAGAGILLWRWLQQRAQHIVGTANGVRVLRTPESRFVDLPDYAFAPHYAEVDGLRMHYVDEGPRDGEVVLMLHGEPSWSYLYRKMIPLFTAAGHRAVAPDLIGFGKSDKLADRSAYTYQRHVDWAWEWLQAVDLNGITLVCQDWGALIGLRLVAEHPECFVRVVLTNGALVTGDEDLPQAFKAWLRFSQLAPVLPIGQILQTGTVSRLPKPVRDAYAAPFPSEVYKAGARAFPALVPIKPDDAAAPANRKAWEALREFEKPFLTAFGDSDPITGGADRFFQRLVPGAQGQAHTTVRDAGHFIQEDKGEELAQIVLDFIAGKGISDGVDA